MTALRLFVSLHCSILRYLTSWQVGGKISQKRLTYFPYKSNKRMFPEWAMEIPYVSGVQNSRTCAQLYFLSSSERQVDKIRWNFKCWFWLVIVSVSPVMFFALLPHVALDAILFCPNRTVHQRLCVNGPGSSVNLQRWWVQEYRHWNHRGKMRQVLSHARNLLPSTRSLIKKY